MAVDEKSFATFDVLVVRHFFNTRGLLAKLLAVRFGDWKSIPRQHWIYDEMLIG